MPSSCSRRLWPWWRFTFRDYGVTWDEPGLRTYGRMLVDWYASGFTDGRAFEFANLRYYGGAFDIVATLLEPLAPFDPYAARHLLGGLIGVAGLLLTWRLARQLGGPRAGLIALGLLATLPGWWGHMFFNSKDVPFAVGMLAAVAAWIRILDEWPRPRLAQRGAARPRRRPDAGHSGRRRAARCLLRAHPRLPVAAGDRSWQVGPAPRRRSVPA